MRANTPKTAQRPKSELDTPVKERIVQNAHTLFIRYGVNISTETIARRTCSGMS